MQNTKLLLNPRFAKSESMPNKRLGNTFATNICGMAYNNTQLPLLTWLRTKNFYGVIVKFPLRICE